MTRKCDMCGNEAKWFASPLGNPDEPALCADHMRLLIKGKGAIK